MTEHAPPRTERVDFRATSDPALQESADRGEANLLSYRELYELWERQQWATQDLDFTQDRIDWHERIDAEERFERMYGLSSFFVGEQRVAAELGPIMRAVPDEDMRIFLCTQIADEARHVAFFDRFYARGRRARGRRPAGAPGGDQRAPQPRVQRALRRDAEAAASTAWRVEPEDLETLVEAITIYHMVIEGMLALTGQHFIIDYNERGRHAARASSRASPTSRATSTATWPSARASCATWPARTRATATAIQRTLAEVAAGGRGRAAPEVDPADVGDDAELFGATLDETRAFALQALERRLKVIGLAAVA